MRQGRSLRRRPTGGGVNAPVNRIDFVGRLYRISADTRFKGCLTRIIKENGVSLLLTHEGTRVYKIPFEDLIKTKTYPLPPWVSLARSWDDLDRFLREFNELIYMTEPAQLEDGKYFVEKIVGQRTRNGETEYQIKWLGYERARDLSWETRLALVEDLNEDYVSRVGCRLGCAQSIHCLTLDTVYTFLG